MTTEATVLPAEAPVGHGRGALIMQAALDLVGELGYDNVSMDAIAARAHASKATIYRRWDSKAVLVARALSCRDDSPTATPDTGDLRTDLLLAISTSVQAICDGDLALMTGLLTAMHSDAELARLIREQMVTKKRYAARAFITRAVERGQLPPDVDVKVFDEIAMAMVFTRLFITGEPADEAFITHLVDDILLPVLTHRADPVPSRFPAPPLPENGDPS
jgi:AcrR family transcriptional regulator